MEMYITCRSADGKVVRAADPNVLSRALEDKNGLVWVDLTVQSDEDAWVLRDVFHFHELTIEDCVSPRVDPAKVDDYGSYMFIIVQAVTSIGSAKRWSRWKSTSTSGQNYVVSCHREPVPAIEQFRERCAPRRVAPVAPPDRVLHGLLDALVDEYLPIVDKVDETSIALKSLILRRPDTQLLQRILIVKRNALRLRRATIPQRDIMNRLSRSEFPQLIRPEMAMYYRDVYDHLVRIEYLVEAVRDIADGALNTYLSVVSNRLNEVMKVLTAAATVFLPLTLISGIYGMNFEANQLPQLRRLAGASLRLSLS